MSQKLNFFEDFMLSGIAAGISKVSSSTIIVRLDQPVRARSFFSFRPQLPQSSVSNFWSKIRMRWSSKAVLTSHTLVSWIVPAVLWLKKVLPHSREVTWPTSSDTSQPKPWTSPSRVKSRPSSTSQRMPHTPLRCLPTSPPVVSLVPFPSPLSTPSITPVLVSPTTPRVSLSFTRLDKVSKIIIQVRTVRDNTMVSSMSTRRPSPPTVLPVSTEVSPSPVSVSSSTEVFTSVSTILSSQSSLVKVVPSWLPSFSDGLLLLSLVLLPTQLIPSDVVWWWPLVLVSKTMLRS